MEYDALGYGHVQALQVFRAFTFCSVCSAGLGRKTGHKTRVMSPSEPAGTATSSTGRRSFIFGMGHKYIVMHQTEKGRLKKRAAWVQPTKGRQVLKMCRAGLRLGDDLARGPRAANDVEPELEEMRGFRLFYGHCAAFFELQLTRLYTCRLEGPNLETIGACPCFFFDPRSRRAALCAPSRLARYFAAFPRLVWNFGQQAQGDEEVLHVFADSDWACCPRTRRSTSGGVVD